MAKAACPILLAAVASLFPYSMNTVSADNLIKDGNNWTVIYDGSGPYTQMIGRGPHEDDGITLTVNANAHVKRGDSICISLRDDNIINVYGTAENHATTELPANYSGKAHNVIEFRSNTILNIYDGAYVYAGGTDKSSEPINIIGGGNTVNIKAGAIVESVTACAFWLDYEDLNNSQDNVINNAGKIIAGTILGGRAIGVSGPNIGNLKFTNQSGGYVEGDLIFDKGNDTLILETGSTIVAKGGVNDAVIDGGLGTNAFILSGAVETEDTLTYTVSNFQSLTKEGKSKWTLSKSILDHCTAITSVAVDEGTLELQGNNANYTGTMVVNSKGTDSEATLEAKSGSLTSGITIANSGIVRFLDEVSDGEKTYAGKIVDGSYGAGNIEITKGGTIKLTNTDNSYTGETRVKNGTLVIDDIRTVGTGEIQLGDILSDPNTKGALRFDADNITVTNSILANATSDSGNAVIDTNGYKITVSGDITGGELTKIGNGTLYLTGINNVQEETVIKQGTVSVANVGSIGAMTSKVIFDNNGLGEPSVLEVTASTQPNKPFTQQVELKTDGTIQVSNSAEVTLEGVISGDGELTKDGDGRLTLTGQNVYTGGTVIAQGELELGNGTEKGTILGNVEIKDGAALAFNHDSVGEDKYVFEGDIVAGDNTEVIQRGGGHTVLTGNNQLTETDVIIEYGTIDVMGNGSKLIAKNIQIGNGKVGKLVANDEGDVEFVNSLTIGVNGTLQVGADEGEAAVAPGLVKAQSPTGYIQNNGKIILNHTNNDGYVFDANLGGGIIGTVDSKIEMLAGRTVLSQDSSANLGTTNLRGGTLVMQGVNANLGGTVNVFASTLLEGNGTVGNLNNAGTVSPGFASDNTNFYDLHVSGDYVGQNGILALDTTLADDSSPSDRLVVAGNTSGSTSVRVTNRNGLGAATSKGIQVIEVGGTSSDSDFQLESNFTDPNGRKAIVAGAFGYHLERDAENDWYLKSLHLEGDPPKPHDYQPTIAIYEAYPQVLMQLNSMSSMSQRTGNRFWTSGGSCDAALPCSPVSKMGNKTVEGDGLWVRTEGSFGKSDPSRSSSGSRYDIDMVRVQLGKDYLLGRNNNSVWVGGLNYMYGYADADVRSLAGYRGSIKSEGHGVGATLTNYWRNGFYFDLQSQLNWYDSDLKSYDLVDSVTGLPYNYLAKGHDGFGYGVGVEFGQKLKLRNGWLAVPQLQLVYSGVSFSTHVDALDVRTALSDGQSLIGRLGWGMHREKTWTSKRGDCRRLDFHGIANLYYDFLDGTEVKINDHKVQNRNEQFWGGLGLGATYNWRNDTRSIFAETEYRSSFSNASGNHLVNVAVGFRTRF